jgi:hypothetical protein
MKYSIYDFTIHKREQVYIYNYLIEVAGKNIPVCDNVLRYFSHDKRYLISPIPLEGTFLRVKFFSGGHIVIHKKYLWFYLLKEVEYNGHVPEIFLDKTFYISEA